MRHDAALLDQIRRGLAGFGVQGLVGAAGHGNARHAAVAVVLTHTGHGGDLAGLPRHDDWRDDAAMLLTRRAGTLRNHAGQWALPGGRIDPGETPEQAALRELHEEVGLLLGEQAVLGRLDDFATRSGYVITPVVVWADAARQMQPSAGEVASLHRIPLTEFLREDSPILDNIPQSDQPVLRLPVGRHWIAAPTAAVIFQFREVCLLGRHTRVAHFEQPVFAWK